MTRWLKLQDHRPSVERTNSGAGSGEARALNDGAARHAGVVGPALVLIPVQWVLNPGIKLTVRRPFANERPGI